MLGKSIRLGRIFSKKDGRAVVVALDHGAIAGPLPGIESPREITAACAEGGADAILATKGFAAAAQSSLDRRLGLIVRISGGFTVLGGGFEERIVLTPESALAGAADAAGVTVKFGHAREGDFIAQAAQAAERCEALGLPVMVEALAYRDGKKLIDSGSIALAARAAQEIGADFVKTPFAEDKDGFARAVSGCPVPILILGGEKADREKMFSDIYWSVQAGGAGVAIGRNIWGSGEALRTIQAVVGIVHGGWTIEAALDHLSMSAKRC